MGSAALQDAGSMDAGGSSTNSSFPGGHKKDPSVIGVQSEFASSTKLSAGSLVLLWQGASCLRMRSLRTQICICSGRVSVMALLLVMSVSIWTTVHASDTVIDVGARNIDQWFELRGPAMTRLMADAANEKLNALEGLFRNTQHWSENYLIFMQQLSNRYFNRAMSLLTVSSETTCTCKDMDREVVDNGDREGFKGEKDVYIELLLGRIKGLLLLMRMGYDDEWGIDELFDGARVALVSALSSPEHTLFRDLKPADQMQRFG